MAREIADAFLTSATPLEVYRRALARVTPRVDASFASVFLRDDDDPDVLRLVCAHSWPQSAARWLGAMRIRVGRGPTGQAVKRNAPVEVPDVFADESLREWWDPARELGFASMIALPLAAGGTPVGALSFYYDRTRSFPPEDRDLLQVVAHQLAATAERARLGADLEWGSRVLEGRNESLLRQISKAEDALESEGVEEESVQVEAEKGARSPVSGPRSDSAPGSP